MSNKKNILIVAESIDINDSSASKGRVALIQNLHKAGFSLKVYHYTRKEVQLTDIECISIKEQKATPWYILSKLQVVLKRLTGWNANKQVEKAWGFSFAYFNDVFSIKKALQKEDPMQYDWILTLSKAASFRPHKALLALPQWHTKWLAYVHDPYPMHFYPRPYTWVEPGYYQKQEFFREVSKKSTHALFPSKLLMEWMGSYYPDFLERGMVVPHQLTTMETSENTSVPDYFQRDTFTIVHAGALMKQRNPKGLIEGFQLFLNENPEAIAQSQLLLLGTHEYHSILIKQKQQEIPQLYISSGYVPFEEVQMLQKNACVNVILEAKAEISPFLPGKFPHCVEAGRPILYLGPALSETKRLLGSNYPYLAEIDETQKIAQYLKEIYNLWQQDKLDSAVNFSKLKTYLGVDTLRETLLNIK